MNTSWDYASIWIIENTFISRFIVNSFFQNKNVIIILPPFHLKSLKVISYYIFTTWLNKMYVTMLVVCLLIGNHILCILLSILKDRKRDPYLILAIHDWTTTIRYCWQQICYINQNLILQRLWITNPISNWLYYTEIYLSMIQISKYLTVIHNQRVNIKRNSVK